MTINLHKIRKAIFVCLGFFFLLLGIIGTLLPVIPTMPFLFFAYLCFRNGSQGFKRWYIRSKFHRYFVEQVDKFVSLPMAKKALCLFGMTVFITCVFSLWYFALPWGLEQLRAILEQIH